MSSTLFEQRKRDHIRWALDPRSQVSRSEVWDQFRLIPEALPELDFLDVSLKTSLWGHSLEVPFFISSMTAGHGDSLRINRLLAQACLDGGWAMALGSQRGEWRNEKDPEGEELGSQGETRESQVLRREFPSLFLMGNLGISQVIRWIQDSPQRLVDFICGSGVNAFCVHLNSLQECLQGEGTPFFRGGRAALGRLVEVLRPFSLPLVVKEVGCGMGTSTLKALMGLGIGAVDVSGWGGTHWGRVEGLRALGGNLDSEEKWIYETFADWGISTLESLKVAKDLRQKARELEPELGGHQEGHQEEGREMDYQVWASGGVRSGLDAAKALALGAQMVGLGQPMMRAALDQDPRLALGRFMKQWDRELRISLFCTGSSTIEELRKKHAKIT